MYNAISNTRIAAINNGKLNNFKLCPSNNKAIAKDNENCIANPPFVQIISHICSL